MKFEKRTQYIADEFKGFYILTWLTQRDEGNTKQLVQIISFSIFFVEKNVFFSSIIRTLFIPLPLSNAPGSMTHGLVFRQIMNRIWLTNQKGLTSKTNFKYSQQLISK